MKKKLLWVFVAVVLFVIWLRTSIYILQKKWRDWYYEDWVITTFKQSDDWTHTVYKNFRIADWKYVSHYKNNQIMITENFVNWKPEWERIIYNESGIVMAKASYKNWKVDWEWISYYNENKISSITNFKNWLLDWELIRYDENGQIIQKDYFENGIKIYIDQNWNRMEWENIIYANWEVKIVENYKNWKQDWERIFYYDSYKTTCIYSGGYLVNCKNSIR